MCVRLFLQVEFWLGDEPRVRCTAYRQRDQVIRFLNNVDSSLLSFVAIDELTGE